MALATTDGPPVGTPVGLTDYERANYPSNVVRHFSRIEFVRLTEFTSKWANQWMNSEAVLEKSGKTEDKAERAKLLEAHNKRKLEDWNTVVQEVNKKKMELFERVRKGTPKEGKIEDYRIPQEGHWVTFPLWNVDEGDNDKFNGSSVTITWEAANTVHTAVYYKTTCWYGDLLYDAVPQSPSATAEPSNVAEKSKEANAKDTTSKDATSKNTNQKDATSKNANLKDAKSKEPDSNGTTPKDAIPPAAKSNWKASIRLNPYGETQLFIAAEFIERRYQGAPHLRGLYLKDTFPKGYPWAYLRLDHTFHFGQNSKEPTYRYLVYHPFVRSRPIPQQAFAVNNRLVTATSAATSASASKNTYVSTGGSIAGVALKVGNAFLKDPLHRFDPLDDEELYDVTRKMQEFEKQWNKEDTEVKTNLEHIRDEEKKAQKIKDVSELVKDSAGQPKNKSDITIGAACALVEGELVEQVDDTSRIKWKEREYLVKRRNGRLEASSVHDQGTDVISDGTQGYIHGNERKQGDILIPLRGAKAYTTNPTKQEFGSFGPNKATTEARKKQIMKPDKRLEGGKEEVKYKMGRANKWIVKPDQEEDSE